MTKATGARSNRRIGKTPEGMGIEWRPRGGLDEVGILRFLRNVRTARW
jgi:hypothetical protein